MDFLLTRRDMLPAEIKERPRVNYSPAAINNVNLIGGRKDIDLYAEVCERLKEVRKLRLNAKSANSIRDRKDSLTSATTLLSLPTKIQGEVLNMGRIRTIQKTTIEVMKEAAPELQTRFIELLEKRLRGSNVCDDFDCIRHDFRGLVVLHNR
ncbi:hypothetical protein F6R98_13265 [Candidatus Methylospira mobilis]|uniref:Uncharacterized protein n=1 Tax=Candidatus Methylospira mobilis TaxID=1808979 RepID=A0A5Q0BNZ5_9GAMM|nr:hypothetical protein [Candidatus Methylospira mobilis]QFY43466.1 hypothetical protein F6R98_13265 [Candidatus Methylospira mobilis]WNV03993.1 hypothetical protein RP726_16395 [Candidatus Methylospira mobilis]